MADKEVAVQQPSKKKHRSPAYPAINLAQAIKRAEEFYNHERKNPASFKAAAVHWGYASSSSGALLTAAALKSFGLMTEVESTSGRTIQLSPLGLKIVMDKRPQSPERDAAIKEAALKPKIHAAIWRKWNGTLPSDAELQFRLESEWNFNKNAIPVLIKELKDTILFAKLTASDNVSGGDEDTQEDGTPTIINIGDFVQWESGGQLKFPEPKRVTGFSEDGQYFFVEGQKAGFPINEAIREEPPVSTPKSLMPTIHRLVERAGVSTMKQDVFSLAEGEVVLSWPTPLSQASIEDLRDWLKIVERKITRSTMNESKPTNPRMREKVESGECKDVNSIGVRVRDGVFRLQNFVEGEDMDYCDLAGNNWIWSIGKHKETGEILASISPDAEFYQNPDYECLWLR